jgi:hypothetical protein
LKEGQEDEICGRLQQKLGRRLKEINYFLDKWYKISKTVSKNAFYLCKTNKIAS